MGIDGISTGSWKEVQEVLIKVLIPFLNGIVDTSIYPQAWTTSVIIPLHKTGDINNTDNYCGISLLSVMSKIYTHTHYK